jgi:hypothetical protein
LLGIGIGTGIDIGNGVDLANLDFDLDLKGVSTTTPTLNPTREPDPTSNPTRWKIFSSDYFADGKL